mgnify:CR=1 FL=1
MKPDTHPEKSHFNSRHMIVDLDPLSLTVTALRIASSLLIISILFLVAAPQTATTFFRCVLDSEVPQISQPRDWGLYIRSLSPFYLAIGTVIVMGSEMHQFFKQR